MIRTIANYEIGHFTFSARSGVSDVPDARILCYDTGGDRCAQIDFLDLGGVPRAPLANRVDAGVVHLTFDLNRYQAIVDLLRNEDHLRVWCVPPLAGLYTGREPVGEGESGFGSPDISELMGERVRIQVPPP